MGERSLAIGVEMASSDGCVNVYIFFRPMARELRGLEAAVHWGRDALWRLTTPG